MSYPPSSPGYPPTSPYGAPQQQPGRPAAPAAAAAPAGENPLPTYLLGGVAGLGVVSYLLSFVGLTETSTGGFSLVSHGEWDIYAALLAALVAGVSLLPKQKKRAALVAVLSTFGFLLVIRNVIAALDTVTWAYWVVLGLTLVQTGLALWAVLLESGIIAPPAPKPQFEPQAPQYGQYGGPSQYYGQQSQPQHSAQPYQQAPPQQQRPGYPSQYGGGYPSGPSTGGFQAQQNPQGGPQSGPAGGHNGPPTPPTGFPAFGQPQQQQPSSSSSNASAPTTQVPTQQPTQHSSSQQSGPSQS
ncbi:MULTISPECIES: DUF5336 domain-containing protein [unclassified Mycolicibacterium]|uniref:DUF5336 domain-containing protein n=1 Tax=unclassified Mycolicibacterium TaxID=2636767 RepID=UPI002ED8A524